MRFDDPEEAFARMPVLRRADGLGLRWLGPMVEHPDHSMWVDELGRAAWGWLEGCGWQEAWPAADPCGDLRGRGGVGVVDLLLDDRGLRLAPQSVEPATMTE